MVDQALVLFGPATQKYAESDVRREGAEADDDTFIALTQASGVRTHLYVSATAAQLGPRFRVLGAKAGCYRVGGPVLPARLPDSTQTCATPTSTRPTYGRRT